MESEDRTSIQIITENMTMESHIITMVSNGIEVEMIAITVIFTHR